MRYMVIVFLSCGALPLVGAANAQQQTALKAPEDYDYSAAMKKVAARFKGAPGVYLHLGDPITYANPNTAWARGGTGHTPEEKAFLKWSHAGDRDNKDGWYLASVDVQGGRSHTAASGLRANQMLDGGRNGLPALADLVKKYQPQLALYMLVTNDLAAGRPVEQYAADVAKAVDLLLDNGVVVIVSTIPPFRGKSKEVTEFNAALRKLARSKQVPLLDLYAEMKARAGDDMEKAYLSADGVHLSHEPPGGPATEENLKKSGYLLRCYLAVHKGMEVKAKVFDAK